MMAGLQQMPSNAKEVLHESMHGQELLRLSRRFKLPHLSFPMSRRLMRDVIVYRSGLTKGTGVLSGARRIDVTMSITRIPL